MDQKGRTSVFLIYNKYLLQLLTALREVNLTAKESVRAVLKAAGVRAIDPESERYITMAAGNLGPGAEDALILPGVRLSSLIADVTGGALIAAPYTALLDVLAATYHADDDVLATQALRAISAVQSGSPDAQGHVAAIFDDEVQARLNELIRVIRAQAGVPQGTPAPSGEDAGEDERGNAFMDALAGSSIAKIAREIADELVDSEALKDLETDPSKIDFASLLDPTSKLGGIAKHVSTKLQEQLGSGKLEQGKLMQEVMTMFGNLNNTGSADNPLLSQVMNMARQMGTTMNGGGPKMPAPAMPGDAANARVKLQEKFARKNQQFKS